MKINNVAELNEVKSIALNEINNSKCRVLICAGTGCLAGGSGKIYDKITELVNGNNNVTVSLENHVDHPVGIKKSGCHGFCEMGPLMRIEPLGILYTNLYFLFSGLFPETLVPFKISCIYSSVIML